MKRLAIFSVCLCIGLQTAEAGSPSGSASAQPAKGAPSGSASARAGQGAPSGSGQVPPIRGAGEDGGAPDSGAEEAGPSDKPPSSWDGSEPLALARPSSLCKAVRLGDWARLTCSPSSFIMDVAILGGSHEGVSFKEAKAEKGVHILFPMRQGDRREIYISRLSGPGGYTVEEDVALSISELWLPGEPAPTIVIAEN